MRSCSGHQSLVVVPLPRLRITPPLKGHPEVVEVEEVFLSCVIAVTPLKDA